MPTSNPLVEIRDWLEQQDREIRVDIAGIITFLNTDNDGRGELDDVYTGFLGWLEPVGTYRDIGKALSFIASFEFFFGKRFDGDWVEPYRLHYRSVLESAETTDHKRALTQGKLDRLPGWIELWAQVGRSWNALRQGRLSLDSMHAYEDEQVQASQSRGSHARS